MTNKNYSYLALGDSYTIGEGVPIAENFPYQTIQLLRKTGYYFHAPEIIAKTGWTTDELQKGIDDTVLHAPYDVVSLLVGVNNQYRGRTVQEYALQFEHLLQQAIRFSGNQPDHVFVLSIPDWGATPYAAGRDREQIAQEIDTFNATCQQLAQQYQIHYIDITPGTREAALDESLLTTDQLHPSGKDYARWARSLADSILQAVRKSESL